MSELDPCERLNALLAQAGLAPLAPAQIASFSAYLSLILRWNVRTNLTSVRNPEDILSRHFVECIACAQALPGGIATLLDFGSGAGLPGIPIAVCRPEIVVTLAESQSKKAAFLQEAVRTLGLSATVHPYRSEVLRAVFGGVVLRAVDKMSEAVSSGARLVAPSGWLALMTTHGDLAQLHAAAGEAFSWQASISLPGSEQRILSIGRRAGL